MVMGASFSEYEAFCVDEALALRLNAVESGEDSPRVQGPALPGGAFMPGPVI